MDNIIMINRIIKISLVNVMTYIVFMKLIGESNLKIKNNITIVIMSIIEGTICVLLSKYIKYSIILIMICYLFHAILISKISKKSMKYSIILTFISLTITYLIYMISIAFERRMLFFKNFLQWVRFLWLYRCSWNFCFCGGSVSTESEGWSALEQEP